MLNFNALSPKDFVKLSKDILQRKIGKQLYVTDSTNDYGIDITEDRLNPTIVGQAKRYISSSNDDLMRALKKEKENMQRIKPKEYYLFISKNIPIGRIKQIIELFDSVVTIPQEHIFTLSDIEDLLKSAPYQDILRNYHELWNFSTDMLSRLLYKNIHFDTEEMLLDMKQCKEFVSTEIYCECIDILEKKHIVLIQGAPGSGKTITSKMVAFEFANRGYKVHYTTDGNIGDIKSIISSDDSPELVLLDDFLGQIYFNLDICRINEFRPLLSYIKRSKNKYIILNSRITVFQEAYHSFPIGELFVDVPIVSTDNLTLYEKAKIFRNYIKKYFNNQCEFVRYMASESLYKDIIEHNNYNPRAIESMFLLNSKKTDAKEFFDGLLRMLNNPERMWSNEFEKNIQPIDRILLTTLYSLTNDEIEYEILHDCFYARINRMPEIDKTVNQFELVIKRLNKSMLRTMLRTTVNNSRKIAALNPSVNDFLHGYIKNNRAEQDAIAQSALYYEQVAKVLLERPYASVIKDLRFMEWLNRKVEDHSILNLRFFNHGYLGNILMWYCVVSDQKTDGVYREKIIELIINNAVSSYRPFSFDSCIDYISPLFCEPLRCYYDMDQLLKKFDFVDGLLQNASHKMTSLLNILLMVWGGISHQARDLEYDMKNFKKLAVENVENALYNTIPEIQDFTSNHYDRFEFDSHVQSIDMSWHTDDIISYCETDLSCFLHEDLSQQYIDYASSYIENELFDFEDIIGKLKVDIDVLFIDQDIYAEVDAIIDVVLSDVLPESIYAEYLGQKRESEHNLFIEHKSFSPPTEQEESEASPIAMLFSDLVALNDM